MTASYVHVYDIDRSGVSVGHPALALGYDHALDFVATCSNKLAAALFGLGLPSEKIIPVPNCATVTPTEKRHQLIARDRQRRPLLNAPLRVGFIGRLDRQKGTDRLVQIVRGMCDVDDVVFRIVGGRIVDNKEQISISEVFVEDPLYDADEISGFYSWSDVVVIPSRFEGLPLVMLEAMAHGAVPICTDVGACSEVLTDGVNGLLVRGDEGTIVSEFCRLIRSLEADRARLSQMAHAAFGSAAARTWDAACEALVDRLGTLVANRRSQFGTGRSPGP